MKITLNPRNNDNLSYMDLLKSLRDLNNDLGNKVMNSLIYDTQFVKQVFRVLNQMYSDLVIVGNSFIQDSTLEELLIENTIELYVYTCDDLKDTFVTGERYLGTYKYLKNNCKSGIYLNSDCYGSMVDISVLRKIVIKIWEETHMGEITDAITRALSNISMDDHEVTDIKQVMANLGMKVDGYVKTDKSEDKLAHADTEFMNPPENNEECTQDEQENSQCEDCEDGDEICCKISGNNIVLMFPSDTVFKTVNINGVDFNTLTVSLPDLDSRNLQVLSIIKDNVEQPIVRVPIFLSNNHKELSKKPKSVVNSKESNSSKDEKSENLDQLEKLYQNKKELDDAIKKARIDGNLNKVDLLRRQRRKLRTDINKMIAGANQ